MWILHSLSCVDVEMKQCEDVRIIYSCKRRTLYRRCENTNHTDVMIGSQTHTHAEKHVFTQIYTDTHTQTHTHTHEEAFTHRSFYTQQEFAPRHLHTHTQTLLHKKLLQKLLFFEWSPPWQVCIYIYRYIDRYTDIDISNILWHSYPTF